MALREPRFTDRHPGDFNSFRHRRENTAISFVAPGPTCEAKTPLPGIPLEENPLRMRLFAGRFLPITFKNQDNLSEMTINGGWEILRHALRPRVGVSAFEAWFRTVEGNLEGDTLTLRCPDRFSRDWIRGRYGAVLSDVAGAQTKIAFTINSTLGANETAVPATPALTPGPVSSVPKDPSLESFVAGPENVLALEAARAVAQGQAGHCIPLVLSGTSGSGKSHLCRAIRRGAQGPVVYRSSDEYTSEVTRAMRSGQMDALRQRYRRSLNVLILEDIHFFAGRRATQIELFHTLDHLLSHGKAVVLSSECPPNEVKGLDPRLASRMSSGLIAQIAAPALKTRRAILREKAAGGGIRIPQACLETLAQLPVRSVRDLLAGLNQIVARATLLRRPVTPDLVAEAIAAIELSEHPHRLEEIIELTARSCGVTLEEMQSRSRRRRLVRPRQIAMYLARSYTDSSLKEIGQAFARDHSSVIYAVETVERRMLEQPQLRYEIETLSARINPVSRAGSGAGNTRGTRRT